MLKYFYITLFICLLVSCRPQKTENLSVLFDYIQTEEVHKKLNGFSYMKLKDNANSLYFPDQHRVIYKTTKNGIKLLSGEYDLDSIIKIDKIIKTHNISTIQSDSAYLILTIESSDFINDIDVVNIELNSCCFIYFYDTIKKDEKILRRLRNFNAKKHNDRWQYYFYPSDLSMLNDDTY